jgi:polar amino acid transport system substrate-binding protein
MTSKQLNALTKKIYLCYLIIILFALQGFSGTLSIVTLPYPPYQYEENGELKGFVSEIVTEIFKRMDQPITITTYPFARCLDMVKKGVADAIFTTAKNTEREMFLDFPEEVLVDQKMSLFVQTNSPISFDGQLSKLRDYQIGVIIGFRYGDVFDDAVKNGVLRNIQETNLAENNAKKLVRGRIDLWMSNSEQALFTIKKMGLSDKIRELEPKVQIIPSYLAFSKKRDLESISKKFSITLSKMKTDGSYQRIIQNYWNANR